MARPAIQTTTGALMAHAGQNSQCRSLAILARSLVGRLYGRAARLKSIGYESPRFSAKDMRSRDPLVPTPASMPVKGSKCHSRGDCLKPLHAPRHRNAVDVPFLPAAIAPRWSLTRIRREVSHATATQSVVAPGHDGLCAFWTTADQSPGLLELIGK